MSPFASELAAARAAHQTWSRLTVRERLRPIRRLRSLLVERADDLIAAVQADIGRPAVEVIGSELLPTAAALEVPRTGSAPYPRAANDRRAVAADVAHGLPRRGSSPAVGRRRHHRHVELPDLPERGADPRRHSSAGNAVAVEAERERAANGRSHALALLGSRLPSATLFQKLPATREAGPQLAEAEVDHIVFTGSDVVGRKLAAKLGERLVPSTLELSGCDAMFVLADANLELAAKAAWFGMTLNRGQTCIAVRRIFVQRPRYAEFVEALTKFIRGRETDDAGRGSPAANRLKRTDRGCPSSAVPASFRGDSDRGPHAMPRPTLLADAPAGRRDLPRGVLRPRCGRDCVR